MARGGVTYTYVYDYEQSANGTDQLLEVKNGDTTVAAYEYDLSGNETGKEAGGVTNILGDEDNVVKG
jgi:YD repeat-containing protein